MIILSTIAFLKYIEHRDPIRMERGESEKIHFAIVFFIQRQFSYLVLCAIKSIIYIH